MFKGCCLGEPGARVDVDGSNQIFLDDEIVFLEFM